MLNTDAGAAEKKDSMQVLSTEMAIDLPSSKLLCLSYSYEGLYYEGQYDEWSLPIETIASAFSCHQ